jgi:hypothetical protein
VTYKRLPSNKRNSAEEFGLTTIFFYIVTFLTVAVFSFVGAFLLVMRMKDDNHGGVLTCYLWTEDL